jgi:DNA-binding transcriptional LysR family regulator
MADFNMEPSHCSEKQGNIDQINRNYRTMTPRPPTLDQLAVLLAIVEQGSFAAAARKLGRATSVISYTIANLEAQLGLVLFERSGTRTPRLTEAGHAVLSDARTVGLAVDGLLARARGLQAGLEAEVALVVDGMVPMQTLVVAFEAFSTTFPTVPLRLYVEAMGAVTQMVRDGVASVGLSGPLDRGLDELEHRQIGAVRLVPVAAPTHPLARLSGRAPAAEARKPLQLVLTDRSALTAGRDFAVLAAQTWRLADLGAKHALLLAGIGWGSMPEAMVHDDLASGRLTRLDLDAWDNITYPLQVVHRRTLPPGPASRWLVARIETVLASA